jgi:hypothetical protein
VNSISAKVEDFIITLAICSVTFFVANRFGPKAGIATFVVVAGGTYLLEKSMGRVSR